MLVTSLWALSLFAILDLNGDRLTTPSMRPGLSPGLVSLIKLSFLAEREGDSFWGDVAVRLNKVSEF